MKRYVGQTAEQSFTSLPSPFLVSIMLPFAVVQSLGRCFRTLSKPFGTLFIWKAQMSCINFTVYKFKLLSTENEV